MYLNRKVLVLCGFMVFSFGNNTWDINTSLNPNIVSSDFEEKSKVELLNKYELSYVV